MPPSPSILQPGSENGMENMSRLGGWARFMESERQWSRGEMSGGQCHRVWWIISAPGATQRDEARTQAGEVMAPHQQGRKWVLQNIPAPKKLLSMGAYLKSKIFSFAKLILISNSS